MFPQSIDKYLEVIVIHKKEQRDRKSTNIN